ncbi:MAG TPA: sterol desaturase [Microscillaceae bacterium]|nr:sterol desaturase [Microscillaceae bacterium]
MIEIFQYWLREAWSNVTEYFTYAGIVFFVFYILLKKPFWFRKIQKKLPKVSDYGRDIFFSMLTITIFATVSMLTFYIFGKYNNTYQNIDTYGWGYYVFSWVWMFILHDTYFYWMHRLMHHPKVFKWVHLVHHRSTNPTPWTTYAFHPLEATLEALILPLIAFSLPVHGNSTGAFFLFQIIYNVYGHLGFELYPKNFHKTWVGRWINTSVAHNQHHKQFRGNYGLYFLFWDRAMGTMCNDYDETYEKTTEASLL